MIRLTLYRGILRMEMLESSLGFGKGRDKRCGDKKATLWIAQIDREYSMETGLRRQHNQAEIQDSSGLR